MAKINIDGKEYQVKDGINLLDACLGVGLDLPYFCWHPAMGSVGSCRQCAVRVYQDEKDTRGKILMSCMTPVSEGMRLSIDEKEVSAFRDKCIEVTMANHPHDCPVCEEGGECHLQDVTIMSHHTSRRYRGKKKTYENQYLGPCIGHEMNRCITCYRCVRFYNDYAGGKDLAALASRENTYFGRHEDGCLESIFSGNLVEVCPTGVFTDKTLARSYNRKWDLQSAPSICHGCSLGCNIAPAERQGKIKRITNRYHGEVNGYFICDKGRFAYDHVNSDFRLRQCMVEDELKTYEETIEYAGKLLVESGADNIIGVASETASLEENILLKNLVGSKNFCSGMSETRQRLLQEILAVYQNPAIRIASLKSMEACDAVLILGEDLMQSAPRMALSVRQATRNLSFELADKTKIPRWQDEAVRILAQDQRSPLIIASVAGTELDEIASETLFASPDDIAAFGFAIAHALDSKFNHPSASVMFDSKVQVVANILMRAKNPLVISGCSLNSLTIIQAAAQVSAALSACRSNGSKVATATSFVLPAANSLGLAMLFDEHTFSIDSLNKEVRPQNTTIVLQNDIYKHCSQEKAEAFLNVCKKTVAISQLPNRTTRHCRVVIPATTFVETEGTLINNEGRAQRFFEVYATANPALKDNWKTLVYCARSLVRGLGPGRASIELRAIADLQCFDDVSEFIQRQTPNGWFTQWSEVAPASTFRIAGMKVPRQPHRYSGRTSLQANIKVAEPRAPVDEDSALGFTMEGLPIKRPPALNALTWYPRWNSNEAVNKFQDEIGGRLRGGDPGLLLITERDSSEINYTVPANKPAGLLAVSQSRLFDSCELTVLSLALAQRTDMRVAMMAGKTAEKLNLGDGDLVKIKVANSSVSLPLVLDSRMPENVVTVPNDVHTGSDLCAELLPAVCEVKRGTHA